MVPDKQVVGFGGELSSQQREIAPVLGGLVALVAHVLEEEVCQPDPASVVAGDSVKIAGTTFSVDHTVAADPGSLRHSRYSRYGVLPSLGLSNTRYATSDAVPSSVSR